ncbi:MAG: hypothetical protein OHK0039_42420 [Bacteroidia bacterium]
MERCDASERTIKGDITYLREQYDAPIRYDRKAKGYRYTAPFIFAPSLGLKPEELTTLRLALETLIRYQHVPLFADCGGLLEKLEQVMQYKLTADREHLPIVFEREPPYAGKEFIAPLLQAIELKQTVSFHYQPFSAPQPLQHTISPYVIKEHSHRWYVLGSFTGATGVTTFALDRIRPSTLIPGEAPYESRPNFDVAAYFAYTYGMTVYAEQEPQEVRLWFNPLQAKYFLSKPFHFYEKVGEDETGLIVSMWLRPNYELTRLLVGMGAGVRVLQPASLADAVQAYLANALRGYTTQTG